MTYHIFAFFFQITLTQETQKKPGRRSALGNLLAETFIGGLDYILTSNVQAHLLEAVEKFDIEEIESDVRQILLSARTYAYNTPRVSFDSCPICGKTVFPAICFCS